MDDPQATYRQEISFILDGQRVTLRNVSPQTLLVDYLHEVGRTGTKLVCGEGGCGACTVMLTGYDRAGQCVQRAVNSCLRPLCAIDGTCVTTTQALGSVASTLDPVQFAIAANNGSQCGYCTPGFVMSMYTLLQNQPNPTEQQVEENFDGHICRCTGYRPILEGFRRFASDYTPPENPPKICAELRQLAKNYEPLAYPPTDPVCLHCDHDGKEQVPYDPDDAVCVTSDHFENVHVKPHRFTIPKDFVAYMKNPRPLRLSADGYTYVRPVTLDHAVALKAKHNKKGFPDFKLLVGNTAVAILKTLPRYKEKPANPSFLLDISAIPALQRAEITKTGVVIGGAATITQLMDVLREAIDAGRRRARTRGFQAFLEHLEIVGNNQIRNVAAVAGNIWIAINGGDPSDLLTVMGVLGATATVVSDKGRKDYPIMKLPPDSKLPKSAIYESFTIPFTERTQHVRSYKAMFRHQNSYPVANAAFKVDFDGSTVDEARIVLNGVDGDYTAHGAPFGLNAFSPTQPSKTMAFLKGKAWNDKTLAGALEVLAREIEALRPADDLVIDDVSFDYRKQVSLDFFYKFFVSVALKVTPKEVGKTVRSAGRHYDRPVSRGEQVYNDYPDELPVSLPLIKRSAFMQASGEAKYTHDATQPPGTLEAAYVYSLVPRGTFHYVLPDGKHVTVEALNDYLKRHFPGFVDYVTYADVPAKEHNWAGLGGDDPIFVPSQDDEIPAPILEAARSDRSFRPGEATCIGAPIGLVVATDQVTAREISVFVRNECLRFRTRKAVLSLDEAIAKKQFFRQEPPTDPTLTHIPKIVRPGSNAAWLADPAKPLGTGTRSVSGRQTTGFQQHFYLETMATLAVPGENKAITLYTSTQTLADNQSTAAEALGLPVNQVRVVLRREGGGFGGKQTRSRFNSTATAVAAAKLDRPVRLVLSLNDNFITCGERHPFRGDYTVAFDKNGVIRATNIDLYSNGGCTYDVSFPVMDLAMLLSDNGYQFETSRVSGNVARTNLLSNTAFRSFGGVQSINITETMMERVAHELGVRAEQVRERNFYQDGDYEWTGFEITRQTLAVMQGYDLDTADLKRLAKLRGKRFADQVAFEKALERVGVTLPQATLRLLEEYSTTSYDFTPYLQGLKYCDIRRIWYDLKKSSDFDRRAARVEQFNADNRWRKRGIAMIPLKYGIAYTGPRGTLDQGGAYVIAYSADGSVLVQHGGVEIGQGIQTKMAQIAAETLGIPLDYIQMGDTDTQVISDASPTAASTGSDLNGGAVHKACLELRERLENFCEELEQYTAYFDGDDEQVMAVVDNWRERWAEVWQLIVSLAYVNRINLSSQARYKTPHYSAVDVAHPHGSPFFYYTYAVAASEVEVDTLTGAYTIIRSDILFDVGKSLNPLIDIGQIEGGFIQGVGYLTTENLMLQTGNEAPKDGYPEGAIVSYGTWKYKPPETKTIPLEFYVRLVDNTGRTLQHAGPRLDPAAVKSSKGIGEPPLIMGNSVFFAIRNAVTAARRDQGLEDWFQFDAPATLSRIQQACGIVRKSLRLS